MAEYDTLCWLTCSTIATGEMDKSAKIYNSQSQAGPVSTAGSEARCSVEEVFLRCSRCYGY